MYTHMLLLYIYIICYSGVEITKFICVVIVHVHLNFYTAILRIRLFIVCVFYLNKYIFIMLCVHLYFKILKRVSIHHCFSQ